MSELLVPAAPSDITPAWLEHTLALRYPGVRVGAVEVVEVRQVTNTHAFLRVEYEEVRAAPRPDVLRNATFGSGTAHRVGGEHDRSKEVFFYNRLAPHLDLRVPDVGRRHNPDDKSSCF